MAYLRVIPRDLFNESGLLKCLGRLWIATEGNPRVVFEHDGGAFEVEQDESGGLFAGNVRLYIGGEPYDLRRPLNSRQPWPLYATDEAEEETTVFTDAGELTPEFARLIKGES